MYRLDRNNFRIARKIVDTVAGIYPKHIPESKAVPSVFDTLPDNLGHPLVDQRVLQRELLAQVPMRRVQRAREERERLSPGGTPGLSAAEIDAGPTSSSEARGQGSGPKGMNAESTASEVLILDIETGTLGDSGGEVEVVSQPAGVGSTSARPRQADLPEGNLIREMRTDDPGPWYHPGRFELQAAPSPLLPVSLRRPRLLPLTSSEFLGMGESRVERDR